jgi:branched-chain amino acid transport system permease protein
MNGEAAARVPIRRDALRAPTARAGWRIGAGAAALLAFGVGAVAPQYVASDFILKLADGGLLLGILALAIAFLMSQTGLVTIGAASVYGGVGYFFAIGMTEWDLSPLAAIAVSMVVVILYAAALGALIIRTTPLAFMMLTLAAGEMISHAVLLEGLRDYTSGADGLVVSFQGTLFGLESGDFTNAARFWAIVWTAAWVAGLAAWGVRRSRVGTVLRATRQNEERMRFSGFDTYAPRLAAFVFVNVIAGACGLLHVLNSGFVSPESLGLGVSTNALVAALIGGTATSAGPLVGGLIFAFAQDEFGARGFTQLLTGIAIVLFIVVFPGGVVGALDAFVRGMFRKRQQESD